jgi:hypothetical protein
MKDFLSSDHDDIYDPVFLAQMVLSPLNTIVDFLLIWSKTRSIVRRTRQACARWLNVLFRYEILTFMSTLRNMVNTLHHESSNRLCQSLSTIKLMVFEVSHTKMKPCLLLDLQLLFSNFARTICTVE